MAALIDRDAVVVGLPCVDASPDGDHVVPPCGLVLMPPTDDLAVDSLLSDHSHFPIGTRVVVEYRAANQWEPRHLLSGDSHTRHSWVGEPYEGLTASHRKT
ncbi:hypothetical protein GCM10018775_80800 [Streptomyces umbrinus]|nr:hypothetical protein GCM10018775_80800 [Streptomyces umbrinus]